MDLKKKVSLPPKYFILFARLLSNKNLLLLDINMPILGGMEALKIIKSKYQRMNSALDLGDTGRQDGNPLLLRPVICYLSQYSQGTMMQFLTEEEHADCYLEKPLPFNELKSLLRLLNICFILD